MSAEAKREERLLKIHSALCDELGVEEKDEHAPMLVALNDAYNLGAEKSVEQACAVPAPAVEACGAECEVVVAVGDVGGVTDHHCLDRARILVNGFPMCAEHFAEYEAEGLVETVAPLPPAGEGVPMKRELDAYTLRWIARQAVRAKTAMPMHMDEIAFNDALSYVAEKCRKEARSLDEEEGEAGVMDQEKCPHRWMHGVMTCPHCGLAERVDDTDALRHELNDWRQFGFAHVGPPITCDQDMRDAIENERRVLCSELSALRLEVAAWRALDKLLGVVSEEDGTVVFRVLDDGSRHCQARLVPGRGDDARRALLDCCRKLQLIPAEPDESREGRE